MASAWERKGQKIIHLEIGEPDFDTPANVVEAGIDALRKGWTHWTFGRTTGVTAGDRRGRQPIPWSGRVRVTKWLWFRLASRSFPSHCLPWLTSETKSSSPILAFLFTNRYRLCRNQAVPIRLREEKDFSFDVDDWPDRSSSHRLIILNSLEDPTGGAPSQQERHRRGSLVTAISWYCRMRFTADWCSRESTIRSCRCRDCRNALSARWFFQNLCHDRLAPGLWSYGCPSREPRCAVDDEFKFLHGQLHPDRGHRSNPRRSSSVDGMRTEFHRRRDAFWLG